MQSCCYMQSSTQSVGLKNVFFFRTTHFPSHFWLSFAAGHQALGGLLDPCRDQTSFHGGGKWWGSWGLGTQNFLVDETSCGKNGESHHLKIASDIKISQDTTVGETSHVSWRSSATFCILESCPGATILRARCLCEWHRDSTPRRGWVDVGAELQQGT